MGLEAATFISELVATNPVGAVDDYATADDHLRLIKSVLQGQFPNLTAGAVNATQAELNILDGVTAVPADLNILAGQSAGGLTAAELAFINTLTSDAQVQIDSKQPTVTDGDGLTFAGATLNVDMLGLEDLAAPGVDRLYMYDFSALAAAFLTVGSGLDLSLTTLTADEAAIDHDALLNWTLEAHRDHSSIVMSAGTGLTGGGTISSSRSFNVSLSGFELLSDPNDDRIVFWDDTLNQYAFLDPTTSFIISGTSLAMAQATTSLLGGTTYATDAEAIAGTSDVHAVTPGNLTAWAQDTSGDGLGFFALRYDGITFAVQESNAAAAGWTVGDAAELGKADITHSLSLSSINKLIVIASASREAGTTSVGNDHMNAEVTEETTSKFSIQVTELDGTRVEVGAVNIIAFLIP